MKLQDFKRICKSEDIGNLCGMFFYPGYIPPGDPRFRTVSVFAKCSIMPPEYKNCERNFSITPDYIYYPEHKEDVCNWITYFNKNTQHSDLVRKFKHGEGTEDELLELIHIFKKGYKEMLIKDKMTSIEKDFV